MKTKKSTLKVKLIRKSDIKALSKIYSEVFTKAAKDKPWDLTHSYKHLAYWFKIQPDMFFGAFENGKPIGGIAVSIKPWRTGNRCAAGIIFVSTNYQNKDVAKKLFKTMLKKALSKYSATTFEAVTFAGKEFPVSWYKKIGIKPDEGALIVKGNSKEILVKLE